MANSRLSYYSVYPAFSERYYCSVATEAFFLSAFYCYSCQCQHARCYTNRSDAVEVKEKPGRGKTPR